MDNNLYIKSDVSDVEWIKTSVHCTSEDIDTITDIIVSEGIIGVEVDDQKDLFEYLEEYGDAWDFVDDSLMLDRGGDVTVSFYVSKDENGLNSLRNIKNALEASGLSERIDTDILKEEDWANNWKQYFKPLEVGEKVLICPEWEAAPDDDELNGRTVFRVNPGMSFGTGMHQSTQLCISNLEKYVRSESSVLDMGCGSGILFIIALLLGAGSASAFDIDPNSMKNACDNAALNGVSPERYEVFTGNILTDRELAERISVKKYDVVLANIVADVIIGLTPIVPDILTDDGVYITSGIISDREKDVLECFADAGLTVIDRKQKDDWVSFVCRADGSIRN